MQRLKTAAETAGIQAATPIVGQTTLYGAALPQIEWWEDVDRVYQVEENHPHEH